MVFGTWNPRTIAISTCTVHDLTTSLEVDSSLDLIVSITPRGVFRGVLTGTKIPGKRRGAMPNATLLLSE